MLSQLAQVRKALLAALAAGVAVLVSHGVPQNQADWSVLVGAVLVAGVAVFFVPNAPPTAPPVK